MSPRGANTIVKWAGLAAGAVLAVTLVVGWRVPAATGALGADVKLVADQPGELLLSASGSFLQGRGLVPGGPAAAGSLGLRNITPRTLAVRVRARPSTPDLDGALQVELEDAGRAVAAGRLGSLRRWSRGALRIGPGERRRLAGRAFLRAGERNHEGRIVDVTLELRAIPVGSSP
jgi:hypothetical protein